MKETPVASSFGNTGNKGTMGFDRRQFEEAERHYENAVEVMFNQEQPSQEQLHVCLSNLFDVYLNLDKPQRVLETFNHLQSLQPVPTPDATYLLIIAKVASAQERLGLLADSANFYGQARMLARNVLTPTDPFHDQINAAWAAVQEKLQQAPTAPVAPTSAQTWQSPPAQVPPQAQTWQAPPAQSPTQAQSWQVPAQNPSQWQVPPQEPTQAQSWQVPAQNPSQAPSHTAQAQSWQVPAQTPSQAPSHTTQAQSWQVPAQNPSQWQVPPQQPTQAQSWQVPAQNPTQWQVPPQQPVQAQSWQASAQSEQLPAAPPQSWQGAPYDQSQVQVWTQSQHPAQPGQPSSEQFSQVPPGSTGNAQAEQSLGLFQSQSGQIQALPAQQAPGSFNPFQSQSAASTYGGHFEQAFPPPQAPPEQTVAARNTINEPPPQRRRVVQEMPEEPKEVVNWGNAKQGLNDFWRNARHVTTTPKDFFITLRRRNDGLLPPTVFLTINVTVCAVLQCVVGSHNFVAAPLTIVLSILTVFGLAKVLQALMERSRGKGTFEATYSLLCYITLPLLLAWLRWLSPFCYIYMAALFYIGVREVHDI